MTTRTPASLLGRQFSSSWAKLARKSLLMLALSAGLAHAAGQEGYYRQPSLSSDTIVFVSEGDLWKVSLTAARDAKAEKPAIATRLTSHPGDESNPKISPDGQWIAFNAQYEGPNEVYVMPLTGGLPTRLTFDGARANVVGWKKAHADKPAQIMVTTNRYSTLPNTQLTLIDPSTRAVEQVPLAQVSDGAYSESGKTLFFTRLPFQGSQTKRYKGGTIQQLWRFSDGDAEATPLTTDYPGSSYAPMLTGPAEGGAGSVIFLSDRDGTMELWSMTQDGKDLKQLTDHNKLAAQGRPDTRYLDIKGPSLDHGQIVYQLGADLWVFDFASLAETKLSIALDSDFDQMRERWVKRPIEYLTAANISHEGDRVAITARGTVFVFPKAQGRVVELPRNFAERNRSAIFMPDGKDILTISDRSGETELWLLPANGIPAAVNATQATVPQAPLGTQLTSDSTVLRFGATPSPDGNYIATYDKDQRLHLVDVKTKQVTAIATDPYNTMNDLEWSTDSRWIAYTKTYENTHRGIYLYSIESGQSTPITTDRYESYSPAWSPDGKWIYFISDRNLVSSVGSPWGPRAPEPHFENTSRIYSIALAKGERWPFLPDDELNPPKKEDKKDDKKPDPNKEPKKPDKKPEPNKEPVPTGQPAPTEPTPVPTDPKTPPEKDDKDTPKDVSNEPAKDDASKEDKKEDKKPAPVKIDLDGIAIRLYELPLAPGNYDSLVVQEKRLLFSSSADNKRNLTTYPIANKDLETKVIVPEINSFSQSGNGKALLVRKGQALHILESSAGPSASLDKTAINLTGWTFSITPREEWQQMYIEAWRLMRDYFWDSNMHGVDWNAMKDRYLPLAQRVATRGELNDAIAQLVGELSALHIFVRGGDQRSGDTDVNPATLGGILTRDDAAGGYRITKIFQSDPDEPTRRSPLAAPGVDLSEGDVIESINGRPTISAPHINALLRGQAGKQVLLAVRQATDPADLRQVIITPISPGSEEDLRYHEWQLTRRQAVDTASNNEIGYVHLRAMGNENFTEFAKGFYPIFNRKGLILDARHNRGGNIDSWILSRLMRKAWFYWSPDVGMPYWNMQYAFRGHVVILCNERTASDGEALAEGVRSLKIGTIIGTRTWGGEIWLSSSNTLVDGGIASAAEIGVYGPEGDWLIEGHGVEPDIIVDNPPHATFKGEDAQLKAAIEYLQKKIKDQPVDVPPTPKRPNKSFTEK